MCLHVGGRGGRKKIGEEDTLQSPGEKLEILAYLLQQHERQKNGYTLYNKQRRGTDWHGGRLWRGQRETEIKKKERESNEPRSGGQWRINTEF